jgi:hypothetical protein
VYARLTVLALLAAALTVLAPSMPADASFTGLIRLVTFTATTSDPKGLTAPCPAGAQVIGMGGDTTGANGRTLIDRIRPNAGLTHEDEDGYASDWTVVPYAV